MNDRNNLERCQRGRTGRTFSNSVKNELRYEGAEKNQGNRLERFTVEQLLRVEYSRTASMVDNIHVNVKGHSRATLRSHTGAADPPNVLENGKSLSSGLLSSFRSFICL